MATGIQTKNGKAFEYACVVALYDELTAFGGVEIEESTQLETARGLYDSVDSDMKEALDNFYERATLGS